MPLIIGAKSASAGVTIANSCRFNHADSATLSKTSSSSSEEKLTISTWIKRSYVGEEGLIGNTSSGTNWKPISIRFLRWRFLYYEIYNKPSF